MRQILSFLVGTAVTITVLGSLAVYYINDEVDELLDRTASLEERVLAVEEASVVIVDHPRPQIEIQRTDEQIQYEQLDVFCLAKNIYHEAGVEDELGKYAVAQVTLNRINNPRYPSTVCDVVMHRSQFSWANDRRIRWTHPQGETWEESKQIAERVLAQGYRVRGLEAANYFHADYVDPFWKNTDAMIIKIGTHIFYAQAL